ncbi:hypothetical protein EYF80_021053 [Liparis tanakae]|uniref:Uncharacterized protein n=1 Tax=Liparis tanakae TaxID=230148 RepID=A0A4Z2HT70_9TELE|nr:hypothetical protein EYF80_021053 [Liparis tanakae]
MQTPSSFNLHLEMRRRAERYVLTSYTPFVVAMSQGTEERGTMERKKKEKFLAPSLNFGPLSSPGYR